MQTELERIQFIGFRSAGSCIFLDGKLAFELNELADSRNVLYAFAVDGRLTYIGKTVQTLRQRMAGYRNPGPTQPTNIRNNGNIRDSLAQGKRVEVYALLDNGLLHHGGFHVNLAAGLEDSLIRELKPPWNGGQKELSLQEMQPVS
ncbi:MAG: GIY-YIG nuclease family protein [Rubrobacter sp.]|nr:GIY-YIG nuclease family protein [Rubrobacter sp.]